MKHQRQKRLSIDTLKVRFDPAQPENAAAMEKRLLIHLWHFCPTNRMRKPEEAVRLGYDAMAIGADAIMCQWSPRLLKLLQELEYPFKDMQGLVPRRSMDPWPPMQ